MKYFGTDGIRGRAGDFPLVPEFLEKLGKASPDFFQKESNVVLIGGDTRESTSPIMASLSKGVISTGYNVFLAGVIPTPVLAYLTSSIGARCGIIVTASHNPWEDNGVKFFNDNGHKLSEEEEANFEKWMDKEKKPSEHVGKIYPLLDIEGHYLAHLKSIFNLDLGKYKIVIDLANGAASELAPFVLKGFGTEPILLNCEPDGRNINDRCGATCVEGLVSEVQKQKADIGIALDGDGDRCILVDEKGRVVDGDAIMAIIAHDMHSKGKLSKATVAVTPYSNWGLRVSLWNKGIKVDYAATGDRYVAELMRRYGYSLGGEKSGHIILPGIEPTGNGLVTALKVLEIMSNTGKGLSELNFLKEYPQILLNVAVKSKPALDGLESVQHAIKEIEGRIADNGRVFVRYSGTEELCRIMVEGESEKLISEYANRIAEAIKKVIG